MKITDIKINGIREPLGYEMTPIVCSWKVVDAKDDKQSRNRICIFSDEKLTEQLACFEGELSSLGYVIELPLKPRTRYWFTVEVFTEHCRAVSEPHWFETGKCGEPWAADWIGTQAEEDIRHPVFFRRFSLKNNIQNARLYVTGLGLYEAYLNGQKVGNEFLTPYCTDYSTRVQVQTYDVTSALKEENLLEIALGNGWYKGRLGYEGMQAVFGDRFGCIAELRIMYEDGKEETVLTDGNWSYRYSNICESDLYDGEFVDATADTDEVFSAKNLPFDKCLLHDRQSLPVCIKATLGVKEIIQNDLGETILDFGQNFTGFVSFTDRMKRGEELRLDYGEILQKGHFYNDNYRTAKASFHYISDGQGKIVRPHFTFYGFRYVRVTAPGDIDPSDFVGNVLYSDLDASLEFSSSSERLNRLQKNTLWGQRSNFLDIPTDCPQRDERFGWTGDANVFSATACFQMDARAFYHKYLTDLRDDQLKHSGVVANYVPNIVGMGGSSVWGDAAIAIPMCVYEAYGDIEALRSHYPLMRDWMEYIIAVDCQNGNHHLWDSGFHFGDWLALDGISEQSFKGGTDDYYISSVCYYTDCRQMKDAAAILGYEEDRIRYERQEALVREAVLNEYFTPNGRLAIDTQTGYLLSLSSGIYRTKEKIIDELLERFRRDAYRIRAGFVGATIMLQTLAENGLEDLAAFLLFQREYPGWMHCVDLGATTIWERWNSVLDDGSISGTGMNSLNHYAYGSVMEYVYKYLAGIRPLEPGYRKALIAPQPNWRLKELSLSYNSAMGLYRTHTKIHEDGRLSFDFSIPFGASAVVCFPGTERREVFSFGNYSFIYQPEKDYLQKYNENSLLAEMLDDPDAVRILGSFVPMINLQDEETRSLRLRELKNMFYLGITPDNAAQCTEELMRLRK